MTLTDEKKTWVEALRAACDKHGPTHVLHKLVQLGIEGPDQSPIKDVDEEIYFDPALNLAVWAVLSEFRIIPRLRRVLRDDLKKSKVTHPGYARYLLDNFVKASPNPMWLPGHTNTVVTALLAERSKLDAEQSSNYGIPSTGWNSPTYEMKCDKIDATAKKLKNNWAALIDAGLLESRAA